MESLNSSKKIEFSEDEILCPLYNVKGCSKSYFNERDYYNCQKHLKNYHKCVFFNENELERLGKKGEELKLRNQKRNREPNHCYDNVMVQDKKRRCFRIPNNAFISIEMFQDLQNIVVGGEEEYKKKVEYLKKSYKEEKLKVKELKKQITLTLSLMRKFLC